MKYLFLPVAAVLATAACGDSTPTTPTNTTDAGPRARTNIQHVVVLWQENHTFDTYFGRYCTAPAGSNPTCTTGPACCEAAPATEASGAMPVALDDTRNAMRDPDHSRACETALMNGGAMDRYVTGAACSNPGNFAIAPTPLVAPYHALAREGALADRYFQPEIGATATNNMYLAIAQHAFNDNDVAPRALHAQCTDLAPQMQLQGRTIADLLVDGGFTFSVYIEGYQAARAAAPGCADPDPMCPGMRAVYPCVYDPEDIPFAYYARFVDNPAYMRDLSQLDRDLAGTLPSVSFVKPLGFRTEHPGDGTRISDGVAWVSSVVQRIRASRYASSTLILLTWDEGGGYYDHVRPPPRVEGDSQDYGTRVPLIAIGPFARAGTVSHVTLEHSSIVKFLEFNFLGATGQLGARDARVHNLGSLLNQAATGVAVPSD